MAHGLPWLELQVGEDLTDTMEEGIEISHTNVYRVYNRYVVKGIGIVHI